MHRYDHQYRWRASYGEESCNVRLKCKRASVMHACLHCTWYARCRYASTAEVEWFRRLHHYTMDRQIERKIRGKNQRILRQRTSLFLNQVITSRVSRKFSIMTMTAAKSLRSNHFISSLTDPIGSILAASTSSSCNPLSGVVSADIAWLTNGSIFVP